MIIGHDVMGTIRYMLSTEGMIYAHNSKSPRLNSGCACGRILFACASVSETLQP